MWKHDLLLSVFVVTEDDATYDERGKQSHVSEFILPMIRFFVDGHRNNEM